MKLIIAGSYKQYVNYLRESGETPETAKYVSCEGDLFGYKNYEIVRIGTWWNNPVTKTDSFVAIGG